MQYVIHDPKLPNELSGEKYNIWLLLLQLVLFWWVQHKASGYNTISNSISGPLLGCQDHCWLVRTHGSCQDLRRLSGELGFGRTPVILVILPELPYSTPLNCPAQHSTTLLLLGYSVLLWNPSATFNALS